MPTVIIIFLPAVDLPATRLPSSGIAVSFNAGMRGNGGQVAGNAGHIS